MKLQAYEVGGWECDISKTSDPGYNDYCFYDDAIEFAKAFAGFIYWRGKLDNIDEALKDFMEKQ